MSATVRVLALWLALLAASPLTAPFCTTDAGVIPQGSMPDVSKVKTSLDDSVFGMVSVDVAAPFRVRESWGRHRADTRVRAAQRQRTVLRV